MILTKDQEVALRTLVAFLRDDAAPVARLTGFAGTGKTRCIGVYANAAERMGFHVVVLAPTGKAALRVQEATKRTASTIHRWLYRAVTDQSTGDVTFMVADPAQYADWARGLVIVDEASMLGREVWAHLRGLAEVVGFKILLVGDPFQLEPVERTEEGRTFSFLSLATGYAPHLAEIVRQAADDPIVRASMILRTQTGPGAVYDALALLPRLVGDPADFRAANGDVPVICHKNATRHEINNAVRARLGRGALPERGEPLLVLKNNYGLDRYNGEIIAVEDWDIPPERAQTVAVTDRKTNHSQLLSFAQMWTSFAGDPAIVCLEEIAGETGGKINEFWIGKGAKAAWKLMGGYHEEDSHRPPYLSANYGYCLTCHRAQGSEWDRVVVVFEGGMMSGDVSSRRWAYTAVTRGRKEVRWTTK